MLILLQTLFFLLATLLTGFLLIEGWFTQSVWVKEFSKGLASVTDMESWAVKKYRNTEENEYWVFMGIYAASFLFFLLMLIF